MPIYEYECPRCGYYKSEICGSDAVHMCPHDHGPMRKLISAGAIIISANSGTKLKNRVTLDDELRRQGFHAPLFKSEETKDVCRWRLNKEGVRC